MTRHGQIRGWHCRLIHQATANGSISICCGNLTEPHKITIGVTTPSDADFQRAQAELKRAAFSFRRISLGRLGLHGRIIPDRRQPEQGCWEPASQIAADGRARAAGLPMSLEP